MDADDHPQGQAQGQIHNRDPAVQRPQSPKESSSRSPRCHSSFDSQDSPLGSDSDGDTSEMDGDGYRRRRAQLMAGLENGGAGSKKSAGKHGRKKRPRVSGEERKQGGCSSDDGHGSDFSSKSTSDDVELSHLASEDAFSDDEETGLTRKDKEHRKRRRWKNARLDSRIAGNIDSAIQDQKDADRTVLKSLIINVLLILSWYLFSLSISIVSDHGRARANYC